MRAWRLRLGLSQGRACALLGGIDQSLYSKLERGERTPPRSTAVLIKRVTKEAGEDAVVEVEHWDEDAGSEADEAAQAQD